MLCGVCESSFFRTCELKHREIIDLLCQHDIIKASVTCLKCSKPVMLNYKSLKFRCSKKVLKDGKKVSCSWIVSALRGTFFDNIRLPLIKYLRMICTLLYIRPPRQEFLQCELNVSQHFVVDWYSFCREVFIHSCSKSSERIGGPNTVVEMDVAKFGRSKFDRECIERNQWVFGGIEWGTSKSFFLPVAQCDSHTLLEIIREWIYPGTMIISDCWKAYDCLSHEGFQHLAVNHSITFVSPLTGARANNIGRVWREVRSTIPRFGVRKAQLAGYLAEFQFKKKYLREHRLHHFLKSAAELYPGAYS